MGSALGQLDDYVASVKALTDAAQTAVRIYTDMAAAASAYGIRIVYDEGSVLDLMQVREQLSRILDSLGAGDPASLVIRKNGFGLEAATGLLVIEGREPLTLTVTESRLLAKLMINAGIVVTKERLCEAVWDGYEDASELLKQYITRLRRKLGDTQKTMIRTYPPYGYMFTGTSQEAS